MLCSVGRLNIAVLSIVALLVTVVPSISRRRRPSAQDRGKIEGRVSELESGPALPPGLRSASTAKLTTVGSRGVELGSEPESELEQELGSEPSS